MIRGWLTQQTQQVVLDGSFSAPVPVKSGIPQDIALGLIMFLNTYTNNIVG